MDPTESDLAIGARMLRVRQAGQHDGAPVVYFHGTPGSRLDLAFGDAVADASGVRLVSFDRPGYGGSTPSPFSLASVGADALTVADALGITGFSTLGHSGGGPFALAAAAVGGSRVTAVGIASGAGPFESIPNALDDLTEGDRAAHALLPGDPDGAARGFAAGFDELARMRFDDAAMLAALAPALSTRDRALMEDSTHGPLVIASMREGLSAGVEGAGWDNVAWIGPWDIDLTQVHCPVHLWYGEDDLMAPPAHGSWLRDHVPDGTLVVRPGEGHLAIADHLGEILQTLGGHHG